jgi:hypothetical protein
MKRLTSSFGLVLACFGCSGVTSEGSEEQLSSSTDWLTISGADVNASNIVGSESEVNLDINPADPTNAVIAGHNPGFSILNTFFTVNSGRTWTNVPLGPAQDAFPAGTRFDPAVAFDALGNVYVAYGVNSGGSTRLLVATSIDGGRTFTRFATIANTVNPGVVGNDKWGITTGPDQTQPGRQAIYVSWTQNVAEVGTDQRIVVSRSVDTGQTFSAPVIINDGSINGTESSNLFADPAVGPAGELYVVWHRIAAGQVVVDRSFDGGVTFGTDILVTTSQAGFLNPIPAQPDRGTSVNPMIDADRSAGPFTGRLYVSYVEDSDATATENFDVFVRSSDDDGANWSAPLRINDDATNDQFMPWLDVDQATGNLAAVWFDARNDVNNQLVQMFSASSTNGAASFRPNIVVSDGQSNQSVTNPQRQIPQNYLEYHGVAGHNCEGLAVWPDNSTNPADLDYFTDHIDFGCDTGLSQLCLLGQNSVNVNDNVRLVQSGGGFGRIGNGGSQVTEVGVTSQVGDIASVARVFLRDRSRVNGDVVSGNLIQKQNQVVITGAELENQTVTVPSLTPFLAPFPPLSIDVNLEPGQTLTLAPGAYRNVNVKSRALLRLSAGTYFFGTLTIEPDAVVQLNKAGRDVLIRVGSSFIYRGRFVDPASPAFAGAMVVYQGTQQAPIERRFEGTLIAPLAEIALATVATGHEGAFFARDVLVRPNQQITCRPFDFTARP